MNDGGPRRGSTVNDPSAEAGSEAAPLDAVRKAGRAPDPGDTTDQSALVELAVLESRIAELELRLRERVEENIVLDNEVRCLQRERLVTQEYISSLQDDAARLPQVELDLWNTCHELEALESELDRVRSELEAFRNRLSRILVDRMVVSARRYPGVYRVGRYVTRRVVVTFRRS